MKIEHILYGLLLIPAVLFGSCVSRKTAEVRNIQQPVKNSVVHGDSSAALSVLVNWKNRGFGSAEPVWLHPLFEKNFEPFRTAFPESAGKILAAVAASGNDLDALESKVLQHAFDTAAGKPDLLVKSWITIRSARGELFYEAAAVYLFEKNTDFESDTLIIDF